MTHSKPSLIPTDFAMPAEWEPHQATWLSWPKDPITWPNRVPKAQEVFVQMIEALTPHEQVHLLVNDETAHQEVQKKLQGRKVKTENLLIHSIPTVDAWIRDYGPIFLKRVDDNKTTSPLLMTDWIFNAWGKKYEALLPDDIIPQKIAPLLDLPLLEPGFVLEGGSIDVNGRGTLLTTEQCLLNKNRNPQLSQKEIENVLKKFLGVRHILWLGEGIVGDDTDGHIDDITRFVRPDTILTALEEDPSDPNHHPLQENLKRLKLMKDQDGRAFNILTLPMPHPILDDEGKRLPASYANFYIANRVVLAPIFGNSQDEKAIQILQRVFPDRKIIGINCQDLVWGLGAIHCVTQQQPKIL